MGKILMEIRALKAEDHSPPLLDTLPTELRKEGCCRICLCEDEGIPDDPLVEPCRCSGSIKCVHFQCLERWMQSKCVRKQKNNIKFIKPQNNQLCELCNTQLTCSFPQV